MKPGQHVAGAGRGQPGRAVDVDRGAAVRRGDHRVGALQQHDGAGAGCAASRAAAIRSGDGLQQAREQALELAGVRASARRRGRAPRTARPGRRGRR